MDDPQRMEALAAEAHDEARRLLDKPDRTEAETAGMIGAAHKSLHIREAAGGSPADLQRGNWLVARCYADAGIAEAALEFARRTMELTAAFENEIEDEDRAFAKEIAARAWALAGNHERATGHLEGARMLGGKIADPDHRRDFFRRLESGPWSGLAVKAGD